MGPWRVSGTTEDARRVAPLLPTYPTTLTLTLPPSHPPFHTPIHRQPFPPSGSLPVRTTTIQPTLPLTPPSLLFPPAPALQPLMEALAPSKVTSAKRQHRESRRETLFAALQHTVTPPRPRGQAWPTPVKIHI